VKILRNGTQKTQEATELTIDKSSSCHHFIIPMMKKEKFSTEEEADEVCL